MITFKNVRWANFLSTGSQFTEVLLNKSSTTLIIGENGSGKSTVLDALCFGLFNKPFRSINKPQLLNSINQKECRVEIEFTIGSKDYRVCRGIKPNLFTIHCDDVMVNQDADAKDYQKYLEENILKLNYKSFTQIVLLGTASFTPFMQLTTISRRELIEDLLDIKVFSSMKDVLKQEMSDLNDQIKEISYDIRSYKDKIELQQNYISKLTTDKDTKVQDIEQKLSQKREEVIKLEKKHSKEKLKIQDHDKVTKRHSKVVALERSISDKINNANDEINFYNDNNQCPSCDQPLTDKTKKQHIEKNEKQIEKLELAREELIFEGVRLKERLDEIREQQKVIIEINNQISALKALIQQYESDLLELNSNDGDIDEEKAKLKQYASKVIELSNDKSKLLDEKQYYDVAQVLLKDSGIKTAIINQYLPLMNTTINKYLQAMDFFASFELDESFSETIKSRHRDKFSYNSFSEGEKQRIDLALLFAWRHIAKSKNSTNTNLLILDEIFDSSLDSNGSDSLYQILSTLDKGTNTFVISHKDHMFDKFRSVIKFDKHNNFSRIS